MSSVSFVIPVFNKSTFLEYIIQSLRSQKGNFEKEFIFIDDGSTDDSYSKLKTLTKGLKSCKILKQDNKGSANATNVGINLAKMKSEIILQQSIVTLCIFLKAAEICSALLNILAGKKSF